MDRSLKINKKFKLPNEINQNEKDQTSPDKMKDQSFIGNKRERSNNEKNDEIICDKCKSIIEGNYLEINENISDSNKEFILNCLKIQNNDFQNNFNEILEEIKSKKYNINNIILCSDCFKKNFFKGGIEKILNISTCINIKDTKNKNNENVITEKNDNDNNNEIKELENELNETNSKSKNIKILKEIYSLNIQLIIKNLKLFKSRYSKIFEKFNLILEKNLPIKNKEEIEKNKEELAETNKIIEKLLNDCTSKEKLQSLNINLNNDNNNNKEELLQLLKQIQLEIENITSNGGDSSAPAPEEWGGDNTKNNLEVENQDVLFNTKKNDSFKKDNVDYTGLRNKNIGFSSHLNYNNIDEINNLLVQNKNIPNNVNNVNNINNINTNISANANQEDKNAYNNINQLLNLSNISGKLGNQLILNYLEKNQVLKKRLGLGNSNPSLSGILSNSQRNNAQSGLNNNILLNNLISSGQISPQMLNQINNNNSNNAQLNNLISENNTIGNDNASNINNLLNSTGINNTFGHRPNIDLNSANELKNFENLLKIQNLLNLINNNNNSLNYLSNNNINTEILLKLLQQNQVNISPLTTVPGLINDYNNLSTLYNNNNNNNNVFTNLSNLTNLSDLSNTLNLIQSINNQNNNNNLQSQLKQNASFITQNKNRISPAAKTTTISNINNITTNSISNNNLNNTLNNTLNNSINNSLNNSINNSLNNTLNNNLNNSLNNTLNNSLNNNLNNTLNNTLCNISNINRNDTNLTVPASMVGSGSTNNNFLFYPGQQIDRQKDVAAAMLIKMFDNLAREKESKHALNNDNNISQVNNKPKISINISSSNMINDKNQSQITNNGNSGPNLESKSIIIESNIFSQKNNNVIKSQNLNLGNKMGESGKSDINLSINANQNVNK